MALNSPSNNKSFPHLLYPLEHYGQKDIKIEVTTPHKNCVCSDVERGLSPECECKYAFRINQSEKPKSPLCELQSYCKSLLETHGFFQKEAILPTVSPSNKSPYVGVKNQGEKEYQASESVFNKMIDFCEKGMIESKKYV